MGLLDEAIREHLELKRRSGADPGAVAREEHEALAPIFPDEDTGPNGEAGDPVVADPVEDATAELAVADFMTDDGHSSESEGPSGFSTAGQDTAEVDMQAVMQEDSEEDPAEREVPGVRDGESAPGNFAGQERLSFE